jgi:hypothetical protein
MLSWKGTSCLALLGGGSALLLPRVERCVRRARSTMAAPGMVVGSAVEAAEPEAAGPLNGILTTYPARGSYPANFDTAEERAGSAAERAALSADVKERVRVLQTKFKPASAAVLKAREHERTSIVGRLLGDQFKLETTNLFAARRKSSHVAVKYAIEDLLSMRTLPEGNNKKECWVKRPVRELGYFAPPPGTTTFDVSGSGGTFNFLGQLEFAARQAFKPPGKAKGDAEVDQRLWFRPAREAAAGEDPLPWQPRASHTLATWLPRHLAELWAPTPVGKRKTPQTQQSMLTTSTAQGSHLYRSARLGIHVSASVHGDAISVLGKVLNKFVPMLLACPAAPRAQTATTKDTLITGASLLSNLDWAARWHAFGDISDVGVVFDVMLALVYSLARPAVTAFRVADAAAVKAEHDRRVALPPAERPGDHRYVAAVEMGHAGAVGVGAEAATSANNARETVYTTYLTRQLQKTNDMSARREASFALAFVLGTCVMIVGHMSYVCNPVSWPEPGPTSDLMRGQDVQRLMAQVYFDPAALAEKDEAGASGSGPAVQGEVDEGRDAQAEQRETLGRGMRARRGTVPFEDQYV